MESKEMHKTLGSKYLKLKLIPEDSWVKSSIEDRSITITSLLHMYERDDNPEFGLFIHRKTKEIAFKYNSFKELEQEIDRLTILQN